MTVRSAWLLPGGETPGQTREDTRLAPIGTMAPESEIRTRDGVIAGGEPFAATGAGAMTLQIGVGRALVQGTDAQGAYPVANDSPMTVMFEDGNAQFGRIDAVALHVYDGLFDTSGQTLAQIEIVPGTPSETPTAPVMPSAYLRLWDVTVPAGTSAGVGGINWSSAIADRRRFTSSYGGILPRGYGLGFTGAYEGQYRDSGEWLERWSEARQRWETQSVDGHALVGGESGKLTMSFTSQTSSVRDITFERPFSGAPIVSVKIVSGSGSTSRWDSRPISITNTGFQIFVFSGTAGEAGTWSNIPVQWEAHAA